ncbi:MAG: hypothetical protein KJ879_01480 [Nanoarchaeota archaeon]|nr:hypothetical protein [Nanoarchaeota archaeon]
MENTTISISKDLKERISTFGSKGESYSDIIERIYNAAVKTQIRELLMNEKNTISIREARRRANKKWPRLK